MVYETRTTEGPPTMYRRTFVALITAAPLHAALPDPFDATRLSRWRYFDSPSGQFVSLGVGVRLHGSEEGAERARRADLANPFGPTPGEFYPGAPQEIAVEEGLPGHIRRYDALIGVAAEKRVIIVGGFRRGRYSWSVRVIEGAASYAIDAGRAIATFDVPDPAMVWLHPDLLRSLLPDAEVFGGDVVLDTSG